MPVDSKAVLNKPLKDVLESIVSSHQPHLADFAAVLSELPGWDPSIKKALLEVSHAPPYYHGQHRPKPPKS